MFLPFFGVPAPKLFLTELSKLCVCTNADFLAESQIQNAAEREGRIVYDDSGAPYHFKGQRCCPVSSGRFEDACRRLGVPAQIEACVFDGSIKGTEYLIISFPGISVTMYVKRGCVTIRDWEAD